MAINLSEVRDLVNRKAILTTLTGKPFQLIGLTDNMIQIQISNGKEYTIGRAYLEKALTLIQPVFKPDNQLVKDRGPVEDGHGPLLGNVPGNQRK